MPLAFFVIIGVSLCLYERPMIRGPDQPGLQALPEARLLQGESDTTSSR
jgi:hypothetical protein